MCVGVVVVVDDVAVFIFLMVGLLVGFVFKYKLIYSCIIDIYTAPVCLRVRFSFSPGGARPVSGNPLFQFLLFLFSFSN